MAEAEMVFDGITADDVRDPVYFSWAYLGQKPHIKQIEVLRSPHKNKIIVCGRRSGKTQMIAAEILRGAIVGEYPKQLVGAPIYKQTLIVFNKIIEIMQKSGWYDSDIEKVSHNPPRIVFKNGSIVEFGSADNPNSLRGEAYDRIFLDESAFIKVGAMHAIKPLIYDKGAPIWETTTPWGKGEVWERWSRGMKGDKDYGCFHYNYKDNPYLSAEGIKEIEKDIAEFGESSVYVQCEIYGNFIEDRDAYFSKELIESCIDENYELANVHPKGERSLGVDVAGQGEDESVMIGTQNLHGEIRLVALENYEKNKPREIVGKVKNMDMNVGGYGKIYIDETGLGEGPTDWIKEELGDDGRVEGWRFTLTSKQDMYSNLKKLMEQGKLKLPNHKKLIYQLQDLRYEIMSNGNMKLHHSERGHDDYPDALALSCLYYKEVNEYRPALF